MRSSPGRGVGVGRSDLGVRTSGLPVWVTWMAFMVWGIGVGDVGVVMVVPVRFWWLVSVVLCRWFRIALSRVLVVVRRSVVDSGRDIGGLLGMVVVRGCLYIYCV